MLYYKIKNIGGIILRKYSKLLTAVLCTAMVFSFTGCGKSDDKDKNESSGSVSSEKESDDKDADSDTDKDTEDFSDVNLEGTNFSDYIDIGDYTKITLSTSDIDDETETQIASNIEKSGDCNKIKKGTIKSGDTINIYYVGKIDGEEFDGGSCTKETNADGVNLEIGSNSFIPGFEDGMIGQKIGKTFDVEVTFPDSYPQNTDLQGKDAVFTVTANYKVEWPELSDAFVKKNFKDFSKGYKNTAKDYTKYIRKSVIKDMAWEFVWGNSTVKDYPEKMLEKVKQQYRTPIVYYIEQSGSNLDAYLEATSMSSEDFESQIEKSAESDLGKRLLFYAIAEKENISYNDDEYKKVLDTYLSEYSVDDEDALNELFEQYYATKPKDIIENEIVYNKVKDFLAETVKEVDE